MDSTTIDKVGTTLSSLLECQIDFQKQLGNPVPEDLVTFENVKLSLEHNTYQQIEFQEFMEADNYEKKEELVDYLLFMLNKYIFLGITSNSVRTLGTISDTLWGQEETYSSAAASCYSSIEQFEFIKMMREHCTFKPWKVRTGENCADIKYVEECFQMALGHFRKLARMTYDNYYDLHTCIVKKVLINLDRQKSGY